MTTKTLRNILLNAGKINAYFEGRTPTHLWRALNTKNGLALFDLALEDLVRPDSSVRKADVRVLNGLVQLDYAPRGISTFDRSAIFKGKNWSYYLIPKGTELPYGLVVVQDHFNPMYGATHYTIAPMWEMPLPQFQLLLNQLVCAVIKESA